MPVTVYNQGDPRQKIQVCSRCGAETGRCREDELDCDVCEDGPLCEVCYHADPHYKENDS